MGQSKSPTPPAADLTVTQPAFGETARPRSSNLRIKKEFSDRELDKFLAESYEFVANFFEGSLQELVKRNPDIETDFRRIDANHFTAKVYRKGEQKCSCKIWLGGRGSFVSGIAYRGNDALSDYANDNSFNESVNVESDGYSLFLRPMGMPNVSRNREQKLSQEGAAEYLWELFISSLQR